MSIDKECMILVCTTPLQLALPILVTRKSKCPAQRLFKCRAFVRQPFPQRVQRVFVLQLI